MLQLFQTNLRGRIVQFWQYSRRINFRFTADTRALCLQRSLQTIFPGRLLAIGGLGAISAAAFFSRHAACEESEESSNQRVPLLESSLQCSDGKKISVKFRDYNREPIKIDIMKDAETLHDSLVRTKGDTVIEFVLNDDFKCLNLRDILLTATSAFVFENTGMDFSGISSYFIFRDSFDYLDETLTENTVLEFVWSRNKNILMMNIDGNQFGYIRSALLCRAFFCSVLSMCDDFK
eukprot:141591_1